ncbi:super-infection exclusion protein B [Aquibacillus kalidii]|uniref:super-infection exclusion protein B n=1 Tax=Aquibacillus kalidii TaxID=2762597 RepID=UPI0016478ECD|nr:super-infection exclusion protein B [Aquibacillus kalidii]
MNKWSWVRDVIMMNYKYWLGLFFVALLATIIGNSEYSEMLGVKELYNQTKTWISLILIISLGMLVASIISSFAEFIKRKRRGSASIKYSKKRLKHLTPREKEVLGGYIMNNTRTMSLSMSDGVVQELVNLNILYRSSSISNEGVYFSYNMQPWAWDYLKKRKFLLK